MNEAALLRAHRDFVALHGYQPGYKCVDGAFRLLPLENDGIVLAEQTTKEANYGYADQEGL